MNILKKADELLAKVLKLLVVALCGVIALILIARVVMRFSPLIFPMTWSDEIVEWSMAYMIFIASALIMRDGAHFKVDLLQERFKGTLFVRILNVFVALVDLAFFVVFLYYSINLFTHAHQTTPILKYPVQVAYASIVIGSFLITVYAIRDLVVSIGYLIKGQPEK
jgi:TRAP-type C4-dicarboxylate transport system permease small subunit